MTGAAAFAVLSVVAAFAVSPLMLIVARALLGVAGATLAPSTLALITNMFRDERQRGKAIAVWATCQFTGGALGPVLAGFLLQHFWWGSVFLVAVPAMGLLLLAGPVLLPEFRSDQRPAGPGQRRAVARGGALDGLRHQATGRRGRVSRAGRGPRRGRGHRLLFVRRQLRLEAPLLDLRLLSNRPFTGVLVALAFAGIAMAGTGLLVTQYLQSVLGFSPVASAVLFAPMGLGVAVGTMTAPALARRMKQTTAIAGGLAGSALGSLLLVGVDGASGLPLVMTGIAVLALGTGPLFALGTGLVVGSVPPEAPARPRRCRRPATTSAARSASRCSASWPRWSIAAGWAARPTRWPARSPPATTFPPARARNCCTPRGRRSPSACTSPASWPR